jgi:hypothetical protein
VFVTSLEHASQWYFGGSLSSTEAAPSEVKLDELRAVEEGFFLWVMVISIFIQDILF